MPRWLDIAHTKVGVREAPGTKNNPEIITWIRDELGFDWYTKDEIPWCAGFVNWCLKQAGEATTNSLMARSFVNYGNKIKPTKGAILVFRRGKAPSGHVGFYVGETKTHFRVLGGNQGDSVSIKPYPKDELLAVRWPSRARRSKVVQGSVASGVGSLGLVGAEVSNALSETSSVLQPLADYSIYITIVCAALAIGGAGFAAWHRIAMMKAETSPKLDEVM